MNIDSIISDSHLVLTECAISERLRRMDSITLHPTLFNTPLIYDVQGSLKMEEIYRQYRDIARNAKLPQILCAPTWRVDKNRIKEAGFDKTLLFDTVTYMKKMQEKWLDTSSPLIIGGLVGPKNDCYSPELALSEKESFIYHTWQIEKLVMAGVDCVVAQTIPAVSEACGIAKACAAAGVPSLISFVINRQGKVLDTTDLQEAITYIDKKVAPRPLGYLVNCVYPTFICAEHQPEELFLRLIGIQANSSSKDHNELEGSEILHQDDLHHWGSNMLHLNQIYGLKILGGCCGTDETYLQYLVDHKSNGHVSTKNQ